MSTEHQPATVRGVNMQPSSLNRGDATEFGQIVEAAGRGRASRTQDDEFAESGLLRLREGTCHGSRIGTKSSISIDIKDRVAPKAEDLRGSCYGIMRLFTGDNRYAGFACSMGVPIKRISCC